MSKNPNGESHCDSETQKTLCYGTKFLTEVWRFEIE